MKAQNRRTAIALLVAAATRKGYKRYGGKKSVLAVKSSCRCSGSKISGLLFYRWQLRNKQCKNKTTLKVYVVCWKCSSVKLFVFHKIDWKNGAVERRLNIPISKLM